MAGRPTRHTPEIEDEIFSRLAAGEGLKTICRDAKFPPDSTVRGWVTSDSPAGISARYAYARSIGLDALAEETLEIADTCRIGEKRKVKFGGVDSEGNPLGDEVEIMTGDMVDRARLQVDARKWLLSKLAPKRYGDRIEIAGDPDNPLNVNVTQSAELLTNRIDRLIARSETESLPGEPDAT